MSVGGAAVECTTVTDTEAVFHRGTEVIERTGLAPSSVVTVDGVSATTLARPQGEQLCVFATANDVHLGETVAGIIDGDDSMAVRPEPGEPPYPETMSRGAIAEIARLDPAAVLVKGDLTSNGTMEEYDTFRDLWHGAFGDRLTVVRGNHESYNHLEVATDAAQMVDLDGVRLVLVDTSRDGLENGDLVPEQLEAIETWGHEATTPMLVFGHHPVWNPDADAHSDSFFGLRPSASVALAESVARTPQIRGYFAGHTHRNRVVWLASCPQIPFVEVACVKDYPGSWAEYRVFESGVMQVHRRVSTPEALAWSERAAGMFGGLYRGYALGSLADRCFLVPATAAG